jgi:hypothetical protein
MNDYWLTVAAAKEAELDRVRTEYEQMKMDYEDRIRNLESYLLEANCRVQTSKVEDQNDRC